MNEIKTTIIALVLAALIVTGIVVICNTSNQDVDGGYAAYVQTNPLMDKKEFKEIIIGPGGTGLSWRIDPVLVSITPYTMSEKFEAIGSKDQLHMSVDASLTYKVDKNKVKEFVEQYGAISEVNKTPEAINKDAYKENIFPQFSAAMRAAIAGINSVESFSKLAEVEASVYARLQERFKNSPFTITSVNIGRINPPEKIIAGIVAQASVDQTFKLKVKELEVNKKEEENALSKGRAAANKMQQEALGAKLKVQEESEAALYKAKNETDASFYEQEKAAAAYLVTEKAKADAMLLNKKAAAEGMKLEAEGVKALNEATGENLIRMEAVKQIPNLKLPNTNVNVGENSILELIKMLMTK